MKIFGSKREKRRYYQRLRVSAYCGAGIFFLLMIGIAYGALNASFLQIKHIEVSGVTKLENIRPRVLGGWTARLLGLNNFLSWPGAIGDVTVQKNYGEGTLTLVGQPAERFAIWCSKTCFWVNRQGTAIEEAPDTEGGTIAKVNDSRSFILAAGQEVLGQDRFPAVAGILDGLASVPIAITGLVFDDRLQEIIATPAHGGTLMFSVRFVPDDKLFSSLNNLVATGQIKNAEYADFTVENRIYLK